MSDVTQILVQIEAGDGQAAEKLLPLVYDELRKLAAEKMAQEKPGQTLQATALVHEAYIRLVDVDKAQHWNSRGHFFAAAAEAMRRILVERARQKRRVCHGEGRCRVELDEATLRAVRPCRGSARAWTRPWRGWPAGARPEAADWSSCGTSPGFRRRKPRRPWGSVARNADALWTYARAWLYRQLNPDEIDRPSFDIFSEDFLGNCGPE